MSIPFVTLDPPLYGAVVQVYPWLQRIVAPNPSKYTYHGTGTYIIGSSAPGSDVAVVDPGPSIDTHRDALEAALTGRRVRAILVTHCHADHSPLAAWLRESSGAPTFAAGPHGSVLDVADDEPDDPAPAEGDSDGTDGVDGPQREAIDTDFSPDVAVSTGDLVATIDGMAITAIHTPGHTSNHTCYAVDGVGALFTGDHIMGWSTTVVAPPDGDMSAYIKSLRLVARRSDRVLIPTHGAPVTDPQPFVDALIAHRLERERAVWTCVQQGIDTTKRIVAALYTDVRPQLHGAARRSVLAHLLKLVDEGPVRELPQADDAPPTRRFVALQRPPA